MAARKFPVDRVQLAKWHAEGVSGAEMSRRLKCDRGVVSREMMLMRRAGELPEVKNLLEAPEGYRIKGTSTLVNAEGVTQLQWIKTTADEEAQRAAQEAAFRALSETLKPIAPARGPKETIDSLCSLYTLTDCHVGMLAWSRETGEPWDLVIAERVLSDTFMHMVDASPASALGVVNQLGDFLHFDGLAPMTPTHHHILDADSRYQKIVEVAVRILRRTIDHALKKHAKVHVMMNEGNHDPTGSVWLRVMLAALYSNEPRISVEQSPNPYVAMEWGKTMLAFHHGHLIKKLADLPGLFAEKYAAMWGRTEFRYCHSGHKHHVDIKEHPGMKVEQHATIAAPDAYAARGGWLSKRQAVSITYSNKLGEVQRGTFVPVEF
jgi:hypothetical protein